VVDEAKAAPRNDARGSSHGRSTHIVRQTVLGTARLGLSNRAGIVVLDPGNHDDLNDAAIAVVGWYEHK